jgi:endonuclease YncB( thermonuclease family)
MSKLFVFFALIMAMPAWAQKQPESKLHDWSVTRVVDGDTVVISAPTPVKSLAMLALSVP